jgi:hypothetical protein
MIRSSHSRREESIDAQKTTQLGTRCLNICGNGWAEMKLGRAEWLLDSTFMPIFQRRGNTDLSPISTELIAA